MISRPLSKLSKKISSGITPLRSNPEFWINGTIPWLKTEQLGEKYIYDTNEKITKNALDKTSIKLCQPNTLSIAMYGEGKTRGNLSIIKKEMATNQACCNIELDDKIADYEYVYYFLKTQYDGLRNLSSGVRKNLNSNDIRNFNIRLPESLKEQQKIAAVLSSLDAKIELNNRINTELEAMAKTLYDYWFVQFDFHDRNGKPYRSSGGKMVYNPTLKRIIPEDWEIKKIGEVAIVKAGGDKPHIFSVEKTETCPIPIYSNGIVKDGLYGFTNMATINSQSVTISARGTIGYCVLRNKPFVPIIRLIVLTPHVLGNANYFYENVKTIAFEKSGSVQQQITIPQVSNLNILYPPIDILKKFETSTSSILRKAEILKEQNLNLTELRDWLLPMLMNGQVCVD
jgi:type I restriction enzyme, S subunit